MPETHPAGANLTELLEQVIFEGEDPRIRKLKAEWEESQRTQRAVFERVLDETYQQRLEYHQICRTPNPEEAARNDRNLLRPMLQEELDGRLWVIWQDITRRTARVREVMKAEREEQ